MLGFSQTASLHSRSLFRVLAAFLLAPLAPGLVLEVARLLPAFRSGAGIGVIVYSYPIAWFVGGPAFLVFERLSLRHAWHYALGSFLLVQLFLWGALFTLFPDEMAESDFSYLGWAQYAAFLGSLAVAGALVFWMLAVRSRSR